VTYRRSDPARDELQRQLQPTPHCIPIERLGDALTAGERDHLAVCARCEAELALWHAFRDSTSTPDENGAVQWVASELHRHRAESRTGSAAAVRANWLTRFPTRTLVAVAASALVALAVAYVAWDPEPRINEPLSSQFDRRTGGRLDVVGPLGDVETPPKELIWVAVNGVVRYDVRVFEIDGTTLWSASSSVARVGLPAAVVAQFVPGKPILWEVTARGSGASLAVSGTQRFRVLGDAASRRQ
jgi:hypothetical protein